MQSIWHGRFLNLLAQKHDSVSLHLVGGGSKSYEEYRELVGYLRGLNDARDMAGEVDRGLIGDNRAPGAANQDH